MLYIESDRRDAAYYFALEEFLLKHAALQQAVVLVWQTDPCVMIGRYQIADREIDRARADAQEVGIVRRPSGGGAIYTDEGTFLVSLLLPASANLESVGSSLQKEARARFAKLIIENLAQRNIPLRLEGRNDLLLEGKKVSGIAQHSKGGACCTHGSLLFDTNLDALAAVLRVDDEKFRTKAVKSIRARVGNIKEYAAQESLNVEDSAEDFANIFKRDLYAELKAKQHTLSAEDLAGIEKIYKEKYANPTWTFRSAPKFDISASKRFPAGRLEVYLKVNKGIVNDCVILGDFLGSASLSEFEANLQGLAYCRSEFARLLEQMDLDSLLGGISTEEFLDCVFD